jgi:hypothetical protein
LDWLRKVLLKKTKRVLLWSRKMQEITLIALILITIFFTLITL